ncbi:GDP-6-deoxy-D-mannose reductase [groundwater metagenome]|uniref:GDP-6-deoxy-D-mannose reductase n=1 Tax=groundwater metagenome TaxID=717931 RepID=A0A098EFN4_9ZZZZ
MKMKVLIIGSTGFAGMYLLNELKEYDKFDIYGTYYHSSSQNFKIVEKNIKLFKCDITNYQSIEKIIKKIKPDILFHFGAYVTVAKSFDEVDKIFETNVLGTVNVMESIKKNCKDSKVLISGSNEVYGEVKQDEMPIKESQTLNPMNPYGISKATQEMLGSYYFKVFRIETYLTRTFHYMGPSQPLGFVAPDFAKQVVDVERGIREYITVGNLDAKRDFLDIRDVVRAYVDIITNGKPGKIYNVCRGKSISIQEIFNILIKNSNNKNIKIKIDSAKLRPSDVPNFVGDNSRLMNDTGWEPEIKIEKTLKDIIKFWRNQK